MELPAALLKICSGGFGSDSAQSQLLTASPEPVVFGWASLKRAAQLHTLSTEVTLSFLRAALSGGLQQLLVFYSTLFTQHLLIPQ